MVQLADAVRRADRSDKWSDWQPRPATEEPSWKATTGEGKLPAAKLHRGLLSYMEHVGQSITTEKRFDFEKGLKIIRLIIESPEDVREELHQLTMFAVDPRDETLATHAVSVAVNAIKIGASLHYTPAQLYDLAGAALFHETGMYQVPEEIRNKHGRLEEREIGHIRRHPFFSRAILREYDQQGKQIAEIIFQEHERFDGSGYPQGLRGAEIHEYAYIIGLLDIYHALVHSRPYRKHLPPAEAMKNVIRRSKGLFPRHLIKKLMSQFSIYPVKSYVRLNNGSIGMVVKANPLWPLKPIITLLFNAQGKRLQPEERKAVDLSRAPLLHVTDVIQEEEFYA